MVLSDATSDDVPSFFSLRVVLFVVCRQRHSVACGFLHTQSESIRLSSQVHGRRALMSARNFSFFLFF